MRIENESVRRIKPFELSSIQTIIYLILQAVSSSRITTRRNNFNFKFLHIKTLAFQSLSLVRISNCNNRFLQLQSQIQCYENLSIIINTLKETNKSLSFLEESCQSLFRSNTLSPNSPNDDQPAVVQMVIIPPVIEHTYIWEAKTFKKSAPPMLQSVTTIKYSLQIYKGLVLSSIIDEY